MTVATPTPPITKPGIYYDVPFEDYILIPAINNSVLKVLGQKSPRHALWYKRHGKQTKEMTFGHLAHTLLLEPEKVTQRYRIHEDIHRGTNVWKAFEAETLAAGMEPIQQHEYETAYAIVAMILEQPVYRFIRKGRAEVTLLWEDEETDLLCKARVDYEHAEAAILVDVKTATDASPEGFAKAAYNMGYYQQAAMSSEGWETLTGRTPAFTFLAIEKKEPFAAVAYETQPKTLEAGQIAWRSALKTYAKCVAEERWPGYADKVMPLELPDWALKKLGVNEYNMSGAMI